MNALRSETSDSSGTSKSHAAVISILLLFLFVLLGHWFNTLLNLDRAMEVYDLNKEAPRLASSLYFSKMTAIAQVTIALIAGAWALVTLGDVSIRVEGKASIICFALANLSFALSLFAYASGYDFIVSRVFHHATFDIDAPFVSNIQLSQQLLFINGLIDLMISVFYGRRIR